MKEYHDNWPKVTEEDKRNTGIWRGAMCLGGAFVGAQIVPFAFVIFLHPIKNDWNAAGVGLIGAIVGFMVVRIWQPEKR